MFLTLVLVNNWAAEFWKTDWLDWMWNAWHQMINIHERKATTFIIITQSLDGLCAADFHTYMNTDDRQRLLWLIYVICLCTFQW